MAWRRMLPRTLCLTFAAGFVWLAMASNALAAGGPSATAGVSPSSGYPGARLVATYTFTPKSSCSAFHGHVSWSFGATSEWATGPAPSQAGTLCTSSTPATAPPAGAAPGTYQVCGMDGSVNSTPACAPYTIRPQAPPPPAPPPPTPPPPSPVPTPAAVPSPSASPSPSAPAPPGAATGTPSPTPSPSSGAAGGNGGGAANDARPAANKGGVPGWPWTAALLLVAPMALAWRFRSFLMGVVENVEVLGTSGADIEAELLHHQASPPPEPDAPLAEPETNPDVDGLHGDA